MPARGQGAPGSWTHPRLSPALAPRKRGACSGWMTVPPALPLSRTRQFQHPSAWSARGKPSGLSTRAEDPALRKQSRREFRVPVLLGAFHLQLLSSALPCSTPAMTLSFLPKAQVASQEKAFLPSGHQDRGDADPSLGAVPRPVRPQLCPARLQTGRQASRTLPPEGRGSQSRRTSVSSEPSRGDWQRQVRGPPPVCIRV